MPRRQKRKKKDDTKEKGVGQERMDDPGRALISVSEDIIAACCGNNINVYDRRKRQKIQLQDSQNSTQPVRALHISKDANFILAGGDDRLLRAWNIETGQLKFLGLAGKKISAATFTPDSKHVIFADKSGDVYSSELYMDSANQNESDKVDVTKPKILLGHFSTIITSLAVSTCGKYLTSADREGKIRVNKLPSDLSQGAPCIQSFCLGHSAFVTSVLDISSSGQEKLISGSGDGTLRLWKRENGAEVDFCPLTSDTTKTHHFEDSKEEGENWNKNTPNPLNAELHEKEISSLQSEDREVVEKEREDREANEENQDSIVNEKENEIDLQDELQGIEENFSGEKEEVLDEESELEEDQGTFSSDQIQGREKLPPAIIHIAYSNERHLIAVCVEGSDKIFLFNTKMEGKLSASGSIEIPGIELPNHLAFDDSGNLWAASGCQGKIPFRIEALSAESFDGKTIISEDSSPDISQNLVCDNKLRIALGDESSRESKFTSKEALRYVPGVQVSLELRKWVISEEERDRRKKNRNDLHRKSQNSNP